VRELQNEIQRMVVMADGRWLGPELLSPHIRREDDAGLGDAAEITSAAGRSSVEDGDGSLKARVEALESGLLREALQRSGWNKSQAAAELGLSRVGLSAKIARYGLTKPNGGLPHETG
jgi:two-component system response regulator HupR/HoxA